jgi:hypothetical protein
MFPLRTEDFGDRTSYVVLVVFLLCVFLAA